MKLVIVGGVAAGASAATRARRLAEDAQIVMFERGPDISFANCGLPYYLGGEITDRSKLLVATPERLRARFKIDVRVQSEVVAIDRIAKTIRVRDLTAIREYDELYDKLLLAPGAAPIRPSLRGLDLPGIFTLRNLQDMDHIQAQLGNDVRQAVIVGAGFIGLELAENFVRRRQTCLPIGSDLVAHRRIAAIAGKTVALDVPLSDSIDAKYLDAPGATVVKVWSGAWIRQVGIEHLHINSPPQEISHTDPHFSAVRINGHDCWLRVVEIDETMNSVGIRGSRITVTRVAVHRMAKHQGSSKPAEFATNGSQVLLDRCSVTGDNVWFAATGARQSGPIVLLNCTFRGNGRAESHQRWSTGMLYDNCRAETGGMDFRNRGSMGSGHGWSMGWGVAWNCVAMDYIIQNPPGAANWMIGCIGRSRPSPQPLGRGPNLPEGVVDSQGVPVKPQSLYLAQLAERLGPLAIKNIGY